MILSSSLVVELSVQLCAALGLVRLYASQCGTVHREDYHPRLREMRFRVGDRECRGHKSGYSAAARRAEVASWRVQLTGLDLHVMARERRPE